MFHAKNKKLFFNVSCGAEINWLTKLQFKSVDEAGHVIRKYDYPINSYGIPVPGMSTTTSYRYGPYFSAILNIELNYKITNHLIFTMESTFRYMFTSSSNVWNYSLYSIGLNTGLIYTFL